MVFMMIQFYQLIFLIKTPVIFLLSESEIVKMQQSLTKDAVIFLTSGNYDEPVVMQVYHFMKVLPSNHTFLCLTDGHLSTGAIFQNIENIPIQKYSLVRIVAHYLTSHQPMQISSLQLISNHDRMFGQTPITIKEYFNRQMTRTTNITHQREKPIKKIKPNQTYSSNLTATPTDTKLCSNQNSNSSSIEKIRVVEPLREQNVKCQEYVVEGTKQKQENLVRKQSVRELDDTNWVIVCKVTLIYKVECVGNKEALNFLIMDRNGDEIQCVCYGPLADWYETYLKKGKYYTFSGGNFTDNKKRGNDCRDLQITFDKLTRIVVQPDGNFQFNSSAVSQIHQLQKMDNESQVNIIGIIKKVKPGQKMPHKNNIRYVITLCDPTTKSQMQIGVFVHQNQQFLPIGSVCLLHNFNVQRKGSVVTLQSGFRSYYSDGSEMKGPLIQSFRKSQNQLGSQIGGDKMYQSVSTFVVTRRTIKELVWVLNSTQDPQIFSLVDCWIMMINLKNSFIACMNCRKLIIMKEETAFCSKCCSVVQTFLCYTFETLCSDFTSSIKFDIMGEHAQAFISMKATQFHKFTKQQKRAYLDTLKYKNVAIKLKTQASHHKGSNGFSHSVWGIEQLDAKATLKQITNELKKSIW